MVDIVEGAVAPDFEIPMGGDKPTRLSSLRGRPVVVYFYPKDDTPGCTTEAIDFTSALPDFERAGVAVVGISPDTERKHSRFAEKHGIGFPLVADPDHAVIDAYGTWVEKSLYGRTYMGVERATFLVGPDGRIARVWHRVRVPGHVAEVLTAAEEIGRNPALSVKGKPARKGKINPDKL